MVDIATLSQEGFSCNSAQLIFRSFEHRAYFFPYLHSLHSSQVVFSDANVLMAHKQTEFEYTALTLTQNKPDCVRVPERMWATTHTGNFSPFPQTPGYFLQTIHQQWFFFVSPDEDGRSWFGTGAIRCYIRV